MPAPICDACCRLPPEYRICKFCWGYRLSGTHGLTQSCNDLAASTELQNLQLAIRLKGRCLLHASNCPTDQNQRKHNVTVVLQSHCLQEIQHLSHVMVGEPFHKCFRSDSGSSSRKRTLSRILSNIAPNPQHGQFRSWQFEQHRQFGLRSDGMFPLSGLYARFRQMTKRTTAH